MTSTLLAGPILRRVTENRVCLWIATSQRITPILKVFSRESEILGESDQKDLYKQCVQVGENLFVYLLQAHSFIEKKYPLNTLLYYQIQEVGGLQAWDLSNLAYGNLKHPSFFIPEKLQQLLHGSCRKPHGGENSPDALSYGDDVLEASYSDLSKRPAVLLLTGDQIYADDVSVSVFSMLRKQARILMGEDKSLPTGNVTAPTINPQTTPLYGRKRILKDYKSGFSSGESENHLFSFGEFAAMYIYAFGNLPNWKPDDWTQLSTQDMEDAAKVQLVFKDQQASVENFQATLAKVRKLLANIPTYMILDDHDVTDDWNITTDWYDEVRHSPLGRRIVSNAVAAYWAFQGWGNDVDNLDKDFPFTISQFLLDKHNEAENAERYDLHIWKTRGLGFSVPTNPPIIAIDSRTQRMASIGSYLPILLDNYARDWLRIEWAKLKTTLTISTDTCPIFIATTPVLGFSVMELLQKTLYTFADLVESTKYINYIETLLGIKGYFTQKIIDIGDIEAWTSNEQSLLSLMDCLNHDMNIKQCVILSGDVHYSFSAIGKYSLNTDKMYCYQLNSSSIKNSPDKAQSRDIEVASKFHSGGISKHSGLPKKLLPGLFTKFWQLAVQLLVSPSIATPVTAECTLGLILFKDGLPVQHNLLQQGREVIYPLPDIAQIKTRLD